MSTPIERLKLRYEASMIKKFKETYGQSNKCICGYCHDISSSDTWQTCKVCKKFVKKDSVMCCTCFEANKQSIFVNKNYKFGGKYKKG